MAQDFKRTCGGRAVPVGNIHLTLVFLGNVERARQPRLEALATGVNGTPFELVVEPVEYWCHNRIVWAGTRRCPEALQDLVTRLGQALAAEGVQQEKRPYVPHITLLRNARRAPAASMLRAISWPVSRFALVESVPRERGRAYEVVRDWPLTA